MIKLVLISALVAIAAADVSHIVRPAFRRPVYGQASVAVVPEVRRLPQVPVSSGHGPEIAIISLRNDISPDGSYEYAYQTSNGIAAQESAQIRAVGQEAAKSAQGSFSFTSPEGVPVQITYVADENGYQPVGDVIPQIPAAILRSIEYNAAHPQPQEHLAPGRRF